MGGSQSTSSGFDDFSSFSTGPVTGFGRNERRNGESSFFSSSSSFASYTPGPGFGDDLGGVRLGVSSSFPSTVSHSAAFPASNNMAYGSPLPDPLWARLSNAAREIDSSLQFGAPSGNILSSPLQTSIDNAPPKLYSPPDRGAPDFEKAVGKAFSEATRPGFIFDRQPFKSPHESANCIYTGRVKSLSGSCFEISQKVRLPEDSCKQPLQPLPCQLGATHIGYGSDSLNLRFGMASEPHQILYVGVDAPKFGGTQAFTIHSSAGLLNTTQLRLSTDHTSIEMKTDSLPYANFPEKTYRAMEMSVKNSSLTTPTLSNALHVDKIDTVGKISFMHHNKDYGRSFEALDLEIGSSVRKVWNKESMSSLGINYGKNEGLSVFSQYKGKLNDFSEAEILVKASKDGLNGRVSFLVGSKRFNQGRV